MNRCISSIGSTVTTTINTNAMPTLALFATASGSVPFLPQTNRIFVEFGDAPGTVRGSISQHPNLPGPPGARGGRG